MGPNDLRDFRPRTTPKEMLDAWDRVYGDEPVAAPHRDFVDSVIQDVMPTLRSRGTSNAAVRGSRDAEPGS